MNKRYALALEKAEKLYGTLKIDDLDKSDFNSYEGFLEYLVKANNFENPMPRYLAELITEHRSKVSLDSYGGYPLWAETSFTIGPNTYSVVAYGASDENEGEDAIFGMIYIEEDHMKLAEIKEMKPPAATTEE